jgi:predicted TIM-barrel fold metal-dependent hydrolase
MIDSHFHIWRRQDLPWLMGPMQPRIFGPYEAIRRDYPIDEYLADARPVGIKAAVYVQANWAKERALDEVAFVTEAVKRSGFPLAIVAYADLLDGDQRPVLDRLAAHPLVRGVRMQIHWHENPLYRFAARPDIADDPVFRRNIDHLGERGLAFDLQVFAGQMEGAALLAEACPKTVLVLQHAGMLENFSDEGRAHWRAGMVRLAAQPNVVSKLSGLGTFIHRNDQGHIAEIVSETVRIFGADRCLFGSNFPIEKLWTLYGDLVAAYRAVFATLTEPERRAIEGGTAARIYRLSMQ